MLIPQVTTNLDNIHLLPGWTIQNTIKVPEPDIDPNPPQDCGLIQDVQLPNTSLGTLATLFYVQGQLNKYCGWLSAQHLTLPLNNGNGLLSFDLYLDYAAFIFSQAHEFDNVITDANGVTYNLSFQVTSTGQLNVGTPSGGWQPAFGKLKTSLSPYQWHHFDIQYEFNSIAKTGNISGVMIDGTLYTNRAVPLAGVSKGWTKNQFIPQIQQDTPETGGAFATAITNMCVKFW